jgi:hypothetical protein
MLENLSARGFFTAKHVDNQGNLKTDIQHSNTVVTIGKSQIAGHLVADLNVGSAVDWMAVGIGSSTIAASNTTLGSEYLKIGLSNIIGNRVTTTVTNDTAQWIGSFTIDATKIVNEAGLFNASGLNTGSMYARTCFTDINTVSGDYILADWRIQIT